MKLFVVRHGQTTANVTKIYSGHSDVMLTEEGIAQAKALQPVLADFSFDRVYSSDLTRAIDTQRLALPGREGERTALLREIDVGRAMGYPWGQVPDAPEGWDSKKDPDPFFKVGGESYAQMDARIRKFMEQLEADPCDNAMPLCITVSSVLLCAIFWAVVLPRVRCSLKTAPSMFLGLMATNGACLPGITERNCNGEV